MRGPELLRWMLPGMALGWVLTGSVCFEFLVSGSVVLALVSAVLLMKSSGLRPAVLGVVLLGIAVGLGARSCVLHRSSETVTSEHQVKQFELVQSWPTRGDTERWLAVDSRGERVLLEAKGFKLQVGRILVAGVQQILPHSPIHLADFDEAAFLNGRGVRAKYKVIWCGMSTDEMGIQGRFREAVAAVKQRVTRRCMGIGGGAPSGLLLALITGDKSALPRSTRDAFSDVGLSHLVAVSGFHVGLVAGFLLLVLRLVRCPHPWKPYVFLPLVWMYVGLCGWTGSAVRAAAMTSVAACAVALRRKPDGPTVLSAVGLLIVAMWPESMGDLGVGLSFLATAGILLLHRFVRALGWSRWWRYCVMLVGVPVVATACTAPLAWPAFGKLPLCFVASNIVATPFVLAILLLFVAWCVLPEVFSQWLQHALSLVLELFLGLAGEWAKCSPYVMPLDRTMTAAAGCAVALGFFWGLAVKKPVLFGMAGVLTTCAVLRGPWADHAQPQVIMAGTDCVVLEHDHLAVFTVLPTPSRPGHIKWKTRSLIERVSNHPPDSIWWCGTQWAMTPYHIRCRTWDGTWQVISSSQ